MDKFKNVQRKIGKRLGIVIGAVVISATSAAVAIAAIPDSNGVIHGCYSKFNGGLRIVDSASGTCNFTETGLNWNQQGPAGAGSAIGNNTKMDLNVYTQAAPKLLYTLPGLGEVGAFCETGGFNFRPGVSFKNTSGRDLLLTASNGNVQTAVPGSVLAVAYGSSSATTAVSTSGFVSTQPDGAAFHSASINMILYTYLNTEPSSCMVSSQATPAN